MDIKATPYSYLKIFAHMDRIMEVKKGNRTAPVYIRIKPTNQCNHRCSYCSYADSELGLRDDVKRNDMIPWPKLEETLNGIAEMGVKAVTYSGGGEPLVYPQIIPAMQLTLDNGIDLSIITNGQLLDGERAAVLAHAKWVRISFDSADAATYALTRSIPESSFHKVCDNMKSFSRIKPANCELGINFVINHLNAGQIYQAAELVRDLGVNHIKFAARITRDLDEYHAPFKEQAIEAIHRAEADLVAPDFRIINKYEEDFHFATIFSRSYKRCPIKEIFTVIAADSKVYFCHDKAYVSSGAVGDISGQSFKDLWFAEETAARYREFDARHECCHHCVYDERNQLLNSFLDLDDNHINFI